MKRIAIMAVFLLLLIPWIVGCTSTSDEQKEFDFTGTFGITISKKGEISRTDTFVLTQDEELVVGKYAHLEYVSENRLETFYDVIGDILTPDTAEIRLTLLQAFPPESEPEKEMTLKIILQENGEILHVNEWNLDVPRME
ncbi:hypothetical protein CSA56_09955 [candidate division KSB3 bacterium]|uniref:Uncharacterized protein n=1 Tax=candidate division KSB3 bacterium TaxID=2044937 RepID=A0A2G6KDQ4_9BACT|nr:MAG: hypothetical protein CSA56_09955 [candidate division KSB3 bacterium]